MHPVALSPSPLARLGGAGTHARRHLGLAVALALLVAGCASGRAPAPVVDRSERAALAPVAGPTEPVAETGARTRPADDEVVVRPLPTSSAGLASEDAAPAQSGEAAAAAPSGSTSPAVLALVTDAERQRQAGEEALAGASLERALRLEPRNPALWHQLARVRCDQGRFGECESLAVRSNGLGAERGVERANWMLIATARGARGDQDGAVQARAAAERLR